MSQTVPVPSGLLFLPLSEEVIPLLKRAVIPLTAPEESLLPGYKRLKTAAAAITEADYLAHLKAEYARLPASLKGLLDENSFIRQAAGKRTEIEKALLAKRQNEVSADSGAITDWLWQSFYSDAFSALAWGQAGFDTVWLGIDPAFCPAAEISPVQYQQHWPADYPARLRADSPAREGLAQQRLLLARTACGEPIRVGGRQQWLLRLPPSALRIVLYGAAVPPAFSARLTEFLRQDFRYQRIARGQMQPDGSGMNWAFISAR